MKFHYAGKFDGNPEHLKNQRQVPGAVKFREPPYKLFALITNAGSILLLLGVIGIAMWRAGENMFDLTGFILAFVSLVPHELLHAVCFKEDVYMYTNISKGVMFVVGEESMSKGRFIFMSLLPNVVFGFIPFVLYMINPEWTLLGTMGAFAIGFGMGDYVNVFNAMTQMPKNAMTYLYQQNSYWYIPQ